MVIDKKIAILSIVSVCVLIYLNTLLNGFVFDDDAQILKNPWILDPRNIANILSSSVWGFKSDAQISTYYYRPILHLVYMVEYHLFGFSSWGWHFVNIIFHSLNSVMVFFLARLLLLNVRARRKEGLNISLLNSPALLAALIFASHTINAEVVSWLACVTELFFTLFFLLSFYLYILFLTGLSLGSPPYGSRSILSSGGRTLYAASLVSFFLALLAKETALMLPLILLIYDYTSRGSFKGFSIKRYFPYFLVGILYLILRSFALHGSPPGELYLKNPVMQILNAFPVMMLYFSKLLLPIKLSPFYVYNLSYSLLDARIYLSIIVIAFLVLIVWKARKAFPGLLLCSALVVVPLIPTFYLLFNDQVLGHLSLPSDRYLYLSSAGFAILVSFIYVIIDSKIKIKTLGGFLPYAILLLVFLYSAGTIKRTFVWRDDHTLWDNAIRSYPDNYYAHYVLSGIYMDEGKTEEALREVLLVKRLKPANPAVGFRLGLLYFSLGKVEKSEKAFLEVLEINPDNSDAQYNLGSIYQSRRQWGKAIEAYSASLQSTADDRRRVKIINSLAAALVGKGDINRAKGFLSDALKLDAKNKKTLENIRLLKGYGGGSSGK